MLPANVTDASSGAPASTTTKVLLEITIVASTPASETATIELPLPRKSAPSIVTRVPAAPEVGLIEMISAAMAQAVGKEKVMAKAASLASGSRGSGSGSSGGGLFQVLATAADASGWKDVARTLA